MKKLLVCLFPLVCGLLAAGCTSSYETTQSVVPQKLVACYEYGCRKRVTYHISQETSDRFAAIMAEGSASAEAERTAIRHAVAYYEELSAARIGHRDDPKSSLANGDKPGQMDCVDESTNTRHVLQYLQARGLLSYHKVQSNNVSRGMLLDGRYPHWTAVIRDPGGQKWAVDSWYEPAGGLPDVVPLDYWRTRGVMGER